MPWPKSISYVSSPMKAALLQVLSTIQEPFTFRDATLELEKVPEYDGLPVHVSAGNCTGSLIEFANMGLLVVVRPGGKSVSTIYKRADDYESKRQALPIRLLKPKVAPQEEERVMTPLEMRWREFRAGMDIKCPYHDDDNDKDSTEYAEDWSHDPCCK